VLCAYQAVRVPQRHRAGALQPDGGDELAENSLRLALGALGAHLRRATGARPRVAHAAVLALTLESPLAARPSTNLVLLHDQATDAPPVAESFRAVRLLVECFRRAALLAESAQSCASGESDGPRLMAQSLLLLAQLDDAGPGFRFPLATPGVQGAVEGAQVHERPLAGRWWRLVARDVVGGPLDREDGPETDPCAEKRQTTCSDFLSHFTPL